MKWWGWGYEDAQFLASHSILEFWPYAKSVLDIESDDFTRREWGLESIELPEARADEPFLAKLRTCLAPARSQMTGRSGSSTPMERDS